MAGRPEPAGDEAVLVRAVNVQLLHNIRLWGELLEQGAGEEPQLRLTFAYLAAGEPQARRLAAFLGAETDYELYVRSRGRLRKQWFVAGTTQRAPVTLETINAWTEWMIAAAPSTAPARSTAGRRRTAAPRRPGATIFLTNRV